MELLARPGISVEALTADGSRRQAQLNLLLQERALLLPLLAELQRAAPGQVQLNEQGPAEPASGGGPHPGESAMVKALALLLAALSVCLLLPPPWPVAPAVAQLVAPPPVDPLRPLQQLSRSLAGAGLPTLGLRVQGPSAAGLVLNLQTQGEAPALRDLLQRLPLDLPEARVQRLLLLRDATHRQRLTLELELTWPAQGDPP